VSAGLSLGERAPALSLPDVHGVEHGLGGDEATVVVFTCNHCPYAIAWHRRLLDVAADYSERGVRMLLVNSTDFERYPADSLERMRERVERDGGWPAPYLHDADQAVARSFGALKTPDAFVLDRGGVLRYRGAPDGDHRSEGERARWLREALDAVLAGGAPARATTEPVGCGIKWQP
jgi:AhpC/TSA family